MQRIFPQRAIGCATRPAPPKARCHLTALGRTTAETLMPAIRVWGQFKEKTQMYILKWVRNAMFYILYLSIILLIGLEFLLRFIYTPPALLLRLEANRLATDPSQTQVSLFEAELNRFVPNSRGRILHQEYDVEATHDKYGYRNPCFDFSKPADEVILGDSMVYGLGVGDPDTFSCVLRKLAPNRNMYFMGIPGADPALELQFFAQNIPNIQNSVAPKGTGVSMIIFQGNDFEKLLLLGQNTIQTEKFEGTEHPTLDLVARVNAMITINRPFNLSYALNGLKLIAIRILGIKDKQIYFMDHGGSTFYKKGALVDFDQMARSVKKINERIGGLGYRLRRIYLLPDVSEVSADRLERIGLLAGFRPELVNVKLKEEVLLKACAIAVIDCLSVGSHLQSSDYFSHDNHLRPSGVLQVSRALLR
jgi:hypothetical protein